MDFVKRYIMEILLLVLIALTILVRTLKGKQYHKENSRKPVYLIAIDILGSIIIGCSVGIAVFLGTIYFTSMQESYLGFLLGYLLGSLGEKILDVLDLKFSDFLSEIFSAVLEKLTGSKK